MISMAAGSVAAYGLVRLDIKGGKWIAYRHHELERFHLRTRDHRIQQRYLADLLYPVHR